MNRAVVHIGTGEKYLLTDRSRCGVHCKRRRNVVNNGCWSNVKHSGYDVLHDATKSLMTSSTAFLSISPPLSPHPSPPLPPSPPPPPSVLDVLERVLGFQPVDPFLQGAHCASQPARRSVLPNTSASHRNNQLKTSSTPSKLARDKLDSIHYKRTRNHLVNTAFQKHIHCRIRPPDNVNVLGWVLGMIPHSAHRVLLVVQRDDEKF